MAREGFLITCETTGGKHCLTVQKISERGDWETGPTILDVTSDDIQVVRRYVESKLGLVLFHEVRK
jgi:hypothetical protein